MNFNYMAVTCIIFGHAVGGWYLYLDKPLHAIYFAIYSLIYMILFTKE